MKEGMWAACVSRANALYARRAPWLPSVQRQLDGITGERFLSADGSLGAVFYTQRLNVEDDLRSTWGPTVTWKAIPVIADSPTTAAVAELVFQLELHRARDTKSDSSDAAIDRALSISWPSFINASAPMRTMHFSPMTTLASFPVAEAVNAAAKAKNQPRCEVRAMTDSDLDFVIDSWLALIHEEAVYGAVLPRRSTPRLIAQQLSQWLRRTDAFVPVARNNGTPVGFAAAHMLEPGDALYRKVVASPAWYADAAFVLPEYRKTGVGHALARSVQERVVGSGHHHLLLHYSDGSPISGPFWRSLGARPRWESWWRRTY